MKIIIFDKNNQMHLKPFLPGLPSPSESEFDDGLAVIDDFEGRFMTEEVEK